METKELLNVVGLILNIVGFVLLYFYGMPPKYNESYVLSLPEKEYKRNNCYSQIAFMVIIIGYILQLLSTINIQIP